MALAAAALPPGEPPQRPPRPPRPPAAVRALVDAVLGLYTAPSAAVRWTMESFYEEDATFADPLVEVRGRADVEAQFLALKAMVAGAAARDVVVAVTEDPCLVVFHSVMLYRPSLLLGGAALPVRQTTCLRLASPTGRVRAHEDNWHSLAGLRLPPTAPAPLAWAYLAFRKALGAGSSALVRRAAAAAAAVAAPLARARGLLDRAARRALGGEVSAGGVLDTLSDVRGSCNLGAQATAFIDVTAMLVGDLGPMGQRVAAQVARGGAAAVYLVSGSPGLAEEARQLLEQAPACAVTPQGLDLGRPEEVALCCWSVRQLLAGRGHRVDVLVIGALAATAPQGPAELLALQALLVNLQPALARRARVVVIASAAARWLPAPRRGAALVAGCGAVGEAARPRGATAAAAGKGAEAPAAPPGSKPSAGGARAQREAARVSLAGHFARRWVADPEGSDCVSCTPGGAWSAWADALAWAQELRQVQALARCAAWAPGARCAAAALCAARRFMAAAAAAQAARSVVQLVAPGIYVSPGAHYWGQHRADGAAAPGAGDARGDAAGALLAAVGAELGSRGGLAFGTKGSDASLPDLAAAPEARNPGGI